MPPRKIHNPRTNRMVLATGRVGRTITAAQRVSSRKPKPRQAQSQLRSATFVIDYDIGKDVPALSETELKEWMIQSGAIEPLREFNVRVVKYSVSGHRLTVTLSCRETSAQFTRAYTLRSGAEFIADPDHDGNILVRDRSVTGKIVRTTPALFMANSYSSVYA